VKKILLMAYAVSPTKGSEYSVGWNFITELSKKNIVHLICGASGEHIGDTKEIEEYLQKNPIQNLNLHTVKPTNTVDFINGFNKKGFGPAFYIAFRFWHKSALKKARDIINEYPIDIIHQYNPIGFREPGYLWKLDKPFVWGPIGGANFVNPTLLKNESIRVKVFFLLKNFATFLQLNFSSRVKKASHKAERLIFCNTENKKNFEKFIGKSGLVISEQAVPILDLNKFDLFLDKDLEDLKIINIGRLNERKNTKFLLEALSLIQSKKWELHIVGEGNMKNKLIDISIKLEIDKNIVWHGFKSRKEIFRLIQQSDLHALTSLSEANTTVLYETRLFGVPTISLDQNGMHDTLANGNGILVPVTSYDETKKEYAKKIEELIENREVLEKLKKRTFELAKESTWSEKVKMYERIYVEILEKKL